MRLSALVIYLRRKEGKGRGEEGKAGGQGKEEGRGRESLIELRSEDLKASR